MTGPVGCPVGEPPDGSNEMARVEPGLISSPRLLGVDFQPGTLDAITPSERGLPPCGMIQSFADRWPTSRAVGTVVICLLD